MQSQILEALGATVERVRPVSITHKDHFVNIARRRALEANELASKCPAYCKGGFFADQFENLANFRAHYEGTGPEIWRQVGGKLDAFVAAAGTGGTVAGVSQFLKVGFACGDYAEHYWYCEMTSFLQILYRKKTRQSSAS